MVWTDPQATDNSKELPKTMCNVESGSQFQTGETEVTCQAVDSSGNRANCTFDVQVRGNDNT